jgi:hypothetical protein
MDILGPASKMFTKAINLTVVFEVVDDPEDNSIYRGYLKPLNIWYISSPNRVDVSKLSASDYRSQANAVLNITKSTPRELRQDNRTAFTVKEGYLYVLAEPTEEWSTLYRSRGYAERIIETGYSYNIAVSVPPLAGQKAGISQPSPEDPEQSKPKGFNL